MKKSLFLLPVVFLACTKHQDAYVIQKYEWRNLQTAAYTIRHGSSVINAECIGTKDKEGFKALSCSPPLPVGRELSMTSDGHELLCQFNGREVHLK
jgi:hypothetical protein